MVMPAKEEEVQAICSKCFNPVPVMKTFVQPGYNDMLRSYVTTYRCEGCRAEDLAATRARMAACKDKEELATGVLFFSRYDVRVIGLSPFAPIEMIREKLLGLMDQLASGELKLKIDTRSAIPIKLPEIEGMESEAGESTGEAPEG